MSQPQNLPELLQARLKLGLFNWGKRTLIWSMALALLARVVPGLWFLLIGWLIFSALILVIGPPAVKSQLDVPVQTIVVIALTGWLLMSVLHLAGHLTIFRNRRTAPRHVAWIIGLGVVAGVARAAIAFALPEPRQGAGGGRRDPALCGADAAAGLGPGAERVHLHQPERAIQSRAGRV
jgi:hypothetical protein